MQVALRIAERFPAQIGQPYKWVQQTLLLFTPASPFLALPSSPSALPPDLQLHEVVASSEGHQVGLVGGGGMDTDHVHRT